MRGSIFVYLKFEGLKSKVKLDFADLLYFLRLVWREKSKVVALSLELIYFS